VPSIQLTPLGPDGRTEVAAWLKDNVASLPDSVRIALEQHAVLYDGLAGTRRKLSQTLSELRRALGITSSSERRNHSGRPLDGKPPRPRDKRTRLELALLRSQQMVAWHKTLIKRHTQMLKTAQGQLMKLTNQQEPNHMDRAAEEAAEETEALEHVARLQLGGPAAPSLEAASEAFMAGGQVEIVEQTVLLPVPAEAIAGEVIGTRVEERERFDFSLTIRQITVQVEKKVIVTAEGERRIVSASTTSLGPPRYAVTWDFLVHMTLLSVQCAMPINRLANLLSTDVKRFSSGSLSRLLHYVAERCLPIYQVLFDQLADSPNLSGDDTSCRVIEVTQFFAKQGTEPDEKREAPWHGYRNPEAASQLKSDPGNLAVTLAADFGFEHQRRDGNGVKRALNTTTMSGRSDADDPRSLIVFYRSHLGSFGNLLETLLRKRSPKHKQLTVQSDLATTNLVTDKVLLALFLIRIVGCASHARRPFALYQHEAPDLCAHMLELFKGLFLFEQGLNWAGRNFENVQAVRNVDSREHWNQIKELAEVISDHWSPGTKLGEGARYITRNFEKLTAYLDDPRLDITNNFSERTLRMEKLIESSSHFRTSIEGRCVLDILRTVLQTAVASGARAQTYLLSILRTSPDEIASAPEKFTPRAWVSVQEQKTSQEPDPVTTSA
jgi:hypothetical protein